MQLLFPEIEIVPGQPGTYPAQAIYEGQTLPGSTVVRLTNTTSQENALTVRICCEEMYWQEDWYTLSVLPTSGLEEGAATLKPARRGPRGRYITVFLPRGGTRDVLVRFQAPRHPECRAGRYNFQVEVTEEITARGDAARRSDHVTRLPGVATVLPFYEWGIDIFPPDPRCTMLHTSRELHVVVTNESNDWLYCQLDIPKPQDLTLETVTGIVAVPPPEPGQLLAQDNSLTSRVGTQRRIRMDATTRLKPVIGLPIMQPLEVSALRLDAPTTGQPPEMDDGVEGLSVIRTTDERRTPAVPRAVACYPLIPPIMMSMSQVFKVVLKTVSVVLPIVLLLIIAAQHGMHGAIEIKPQKKPGVPGQPLNYSGTSLEGAIITVNGAILQPERSEQTQNSYLILLPDDLTGNEAVLKAQRHLPSLLSLLDPFLPYDQKKIKLEPPDLKPSIEGGSIDQKPGKGENRAPAKGSGQGAPVTTGPGGPATSSGNGQGGPPSTSGQKPNSNPPDKLSDKLSDKPSDKPSGTSPKKPDGQDTQGNGQPPAVSPELKVASDEIAVRFEHLQHLKVEDQRFVAQDIEGQAKELIKKLPGDAAVQAIVGTLLVQRGELSEGKKHLELAKEPDGQLMNGQACIGMALYWMAHARIVSNSQESASRSDLKNAEDNARAARLLLKDAEPSLFVLADVLYRQGRYQEAMFQCDDVIKKSEPAKSAEPAKPAKPATTDSGHKADDDSAHAPLYLLRARIGIAIVENDRQHQLSRDRSFAMLQQAGRDLDMAARLDLSLPNIRATRQERDRAQEGLGG